MGFSIQISCQERTVLGVSYS